MPFSNNGRILEVKFCVGYIVSSTMGSKQLGWNTGHSSRLSFLMGALGVGAIAALDVMNPALAAPLTDWRFDPTTAELEVTLPPGSQPQYFILAEPARIILDLPNTDLETADIQRTYSGLVQTVRIAEFRPGLTRVVLQLAPNAIMAPEQAELQQIDQTRWVLRPLFVNGDVAQARAAQVEAAQAAPPAPQATASAPAIPSLLPQSERDLLETVLPETQTTSPLVTDVEPSTQATQPNLNPLPPVLPPSGAADLSTQSAVTQLPEISAPQIRPDVRSAVPSGLPPVPELAAAPEPILPQPLKPRYSASNLLPEETPVTQDLPTVDPLAGAPTSPRQDTTVSVPALSPDLKAAAQSTPDAASETIAAASAVAEPRPTAAVPTPSESGAAATSPSAGRVTATAVQLPDADAQTGATTPLNPTSLPPLRQQTAIAFGQPLPPDSPSSAEEAPTPFIPNSQRPNSQRLIPAGTVLALRYPGSQVLQLQPGLPWQEVLLLSQDFRNSATGQIIVPKETRVIGRFETNRRNSRFVVQALALPNQNVKLVAQERLEGSDRSPETIRPNQILEVQVTEDLLLD